MELEILHAAFEVGALVALAALCVFEVGTFLFGRAEKKASSDDRKKSLARNHHRFEVIALASLAALVVTDVGAYVLGAHVEEQLRGRIADVEDKQRPRTLEAQQAAALANALQATPPRPLTIMVVSGDIEAQRYAETIAAAVRAGGWQCDSVALGMFTGTLPRGIFAQFAWPTGLPQSATSMPTAMVPDSVRALLLAFDAAGIDLKPEPRKGIVGDEVTLLVGPKL